MDEKTYLHAMADEVLKSKNARIMPVVAWCEKINKMIGACGGDVVTQNAHAAATASMLIMEINYIEALGDTVDPHVDVNAFNRHDTTLPKYFYRADFEKRTVTLSAAIVAAKNERQLAGYVIEDLVVPMQHVPEGVPTPTGNSKIITPE